MKKPKLSLKEGPMMDHPYTFTIEEEETIKKEYELEKEGNSKDETSSCEDGQNQSFGK